MIEFLTGEDANTAKNSVYKSTGYSKTVLGQCKKTGRVEGRKLGAILTEGKVVPEGRFELPTKGL